MIYKQPSPTPGHVRVTFELPPAIWAERVHLAGTFNDWATDRTPLRQTGPDGSWRVTLELAANQEYQFRYLIDGETWYTDVNADGFVTNEFGSDNSLVRT